ncbi:hypothetical protein AB5I41_27780 [Sphingomonas sp. MMS24-JH45]
MRNRQDFRDLSGFALDWAVAEDGVEVGARGTLPVFPPRRAPTRPSPYRLRASRGGRGRSIS